MLTSSTDKEIPVAWIITNPKGQEIHISKHDGWDVIVVMTQTTPNEWTGAK